MAIFITLILRRIVPLFRINQQKIDKINLILREQIAGVRVIRAFVKRDEEEEEIRSVASGELMATTLKVARTFSIMFPTLNLILNFSSVAVIWFGGKLVDSGFYPNRQPYCIPCLSNANTWQCHDGRNDVNDDSKSGGKCRTYSRSFDGLKHQSQKREVRNL
jgi:ABC-type multidrug transport system fused ATPase/permease subunit